MFFVRPVREQDLDDLARLAAMLDSVNLPANREALEQMLAAACDAFADRSQRGGDQFLFALEHAGRVVGVSLIIAAHGTTDQPHHYLRLEVEEHFSKSLDLLFRHQTLQFKQSYTPHTEIGALILDPGYRGHPARLGKLLSYARFVFVALNRERFQDTMQAELLPPFEPDGSSRLWNWLGHRFTGLSYQQADRLSRHNSEFMTTLFPQHPVYTDLMPKEVRAVIGAVGPGTRGVARMLEAVGFRFNDHIDPFDGGPHFEAKTDDVTVVAGTRRGSFTGVRPDAEPCVGIVAARPDHPEELRMMSGRFAGGDGGIWIEDAVATDLGLSVGDPVAVAPHPRGPSQP